MATTSIKLLYMNTDGPNGSESPTQLTLNVPLSFTLLDLKNQLEKTLGFSVASFFHKGRVVKKEALLVGYPLLTFTKLGLPFGVCECSTLTQFAARNETYRLQAVFKALKELNASAFVKENSNGGSGGCHFVRKSKKDRPLACFKPRDEELGTDQNPSKSEPRKGVVPGEGAEREAAAFALDHGGFSSVPATLLVHHGTKSTGSFQVFVPNAEENVGDYSPHIFAVNEVHKIGLLDIRFLNLDRNDSNLLVVNQRTLIPIDHGLCFPDCIEVAWCDWVWYDWPQTLIPFDSEAVQWVKNLDIASDLRVLKETFGMSSKTLRVFYCMSMLLKKGVVVHGLNLRDIASVVVRSRDLNVPSAMEQTMHRALELAGLMVDNTRRRKSRVNRENNNELDEEEEDGFRRSSSFNGVSSALQTESNVAKVSDEMFFSCVDRLIEDLCAEIVCRKDQSPTFHQGVSDKWFDVSSSISPSELTHMASPRLLPLKQSKNGVDLKNGRNAEFVSFILQ